MGTNPSRFLDSVAGKWSFILSVMYEAKSSTQKMRRAGEKVTGGDWGENRI